MTLRVRWLGRVPYRDAHATQHGLFAARDQDWLLLLEHPHVFTLGVRADPTHVLCDPAEVGAELISVDRGGDVTYHGPGQLVGYPILTRTGGRLGRPAAGMADTVAYVTSVEQLLIDVLGDLGLAGAGRLERPSGGVDRPGRAQPAQDRRGRRAHQPGADDARLRPQRGPRPGVVRSDRALRHRRAGRDLPGRRRYRRAHGRGGRGRGRAAPSGPGETTTSSARTRRRPSARRPSGAATDRGERGDPPAQAVLVAGAGPDGTGLRRAQAHHARPRPGHGVRGSRVPQHLRLLGRRHRHLHAQRRSLHPGLRVLPGRHPTTARPGSGRARAGGRGGRSAWACSSRCSPPWPATTDPTGARPGSWPPSRPSGAAARGWRSRC